MGCIFFNAGSMDKGVSFGLRAFGYYLSKAVGGQLGFCLDLAINKGSKEGILLKNLRAWLP